MTQCIDISSHQGKIDWKQVKQAGYNQAMIRAGWSWYQGGMDVDKRFAENIQDALDAGLHVGVYLYSYDLHPEAAKVGITKLLEVIRPYRLTLPVAFDLEPDAARAKELGRELTSKEANDIAYAACQALEDARYYAILYSTADWLNRILTDPRLAKFDKWVADVRTGRTEPGYTGSYGMWQYSWKGEIPGIGTDVDLNHVYRDYPVVIAVAGLNQTGGNTVKPKPDDTVEQLKAQVAALQAELLTTQQKLASAQEERKAAQEELKTTQQKLAAAQEERKAAQTELKTTQQKLAAAQEERKAAQTAAEQAKQTVRRQQSAMTTALQALQEGLS